MGTPGSETQGSRPAQPVVTPIALGPTDLHVSPMGLGTWAWGERFFWGYGRGYSKDDLEAAFHLALEHGITFLDTAEVYGRGRSETFIGEFARKYNALDRLVIASKFFPYPWRWTARALRRALQGTLRRLGREVIDLYYLHWPFPPRRPEYWLEAMIPLTRAGKIRALGASNVSLEQLRRIQHVLRNHGMALAAVQVEYSLVRREIEFNGFMDYCREHNIAVVAYSPLASGMLTGKYTADAPPRDWRGRRYPREYLARLARLIRLMEEIGRRHGGKTPAQVALNWVMAKGAIPIPGAKNARQMADNLGALGWSLQPDEIETLDRVSRDLQISGLLR